MNQHTKDWIASAAKALAIAAAFALAVLAIVTATAQAAGNAESCSDTTATSPTGGTRVFKVIVGETPATDGCASESLGIVEVNGIGPITVSCREVTAGISPPPTPDTVTLRGYADNNNFNSPATAGIWARTVVGTCGADTSFADVYCTSDGTVAGSPRYGTIRLMIRGQQDDVGASYDVNSDAGTWGIYRCNARLDAFTDTAGGSTVSVYVAGDTFRTTTSATSTAYNGGNNADVKVKCGAGTEFTISAVELDPANDVTDTTIKGATTVYPDDCTITHSLTLTRKSAISGLTAEDYVKWDTTAPPAGVTFNALVATHATSKTVDRTLTPSTCTVRIAGTDITIVNRGEAVTLSCAWRDGRDTAVATGRLATGYLRRETQAMLDTSDAANADFTFTAGGVGTHASTPRTTATDTNTTLPLDYAQDVQTFLASRTTGELLGFGSINDRLDVSALLGSHSILNAKTNGGTVHAASFVVGADESWITLKRAMNARGEPIAGVPVTCVRTNPNGAAEAAVSHGTTAASGDSQTKQYGVTTPTGEWTVECTGTLNGNTLTRETAFVFVSPLSAHETIAVFGRLWNVSGDLFVNVTAAGVRWNAEQETSELVAADDDGVVANLYGRRVFAEAPAGVARAPMQRLVGGPFGDTLWYWANFTVTVTEPEWKELEVVVKMNLSDKTFVVAQEVLMQSQAHNEAVEDLATSVEAFGSIALLLAVALVPALAIGRGVVPMAVMAVASMGVAMATANGALPMATPLVSAIVVTGSASWAAALGFGAYRGRTH